MHVVWGRKVEHMIAAVLAGDMLLTAEECGALKLQP
jgi:hypothetical protein